MATQTSLTVASTVFVLLLVRSVIRRRRRAVIRDIPGPESKSWAFGNLIDLLLPSTYGLHEYAWTKLFGAVYRIKGCFGQDRLVISDPVALQHITNSPNFQLGPIHAVMRSWLYDHGAVITRRGEQHSRLRTALNVGFTASAVRRYRPVFENVAQWMAEQLHSADEVDVSAVLSGGALRAITDVALGCPIDDLPPEFVTLNTRLLDIASTRTAGALIFDAIAMHVPKPLLRLAINLPTPAFRALRGYKFHSRSEGWRIVREKLEAPEGAREGDIYSLLLHSGEKDAVEKKTLLPGDLVAQTSLILLAGQDTTSNTIAFGLLELARRLELQTRLREEIHATISATPAGTPIAYDTMPLLNAFIKEMLRMYPAAALSERVAVEDTVIPLSALGMTTRSGKKLHAIPVQKGQVIMLAVSAYQRLDSRWGANSEEFDPDRWLHGRVHQGEAIGPYANLLSFFAGPHTCLGWRFAILEMQTVVFKLLAEFSFSVPKNEKGPFRLRLATTLLPLDADGAKGAKLGIRRVV